MGGGEAPGSLVLVAEDLVSVLDLLEAQVRLLKPMLVFVCSTESMVPWHLTAVRAADFHHGLCSRGRVTRVPLECGDSICLLQSSLIDVALYAKHLIMAPHRTAMRTKMDAVVIRGVVCTNLIDQM